MWVAAGPAFVPRELPNPADTAFWSYRWLGRLTGITKSGGSGLLVVPLARPTRGNYQIRRIQPIGRTPGSADPRESPNPAATFGCRRTRAPEFAGEEGGEKKKPRGPLWYASRSGKSAF